MLHLVDAVVPEDVAGVKAKAGTKGTITIMIKDMEVTIVLTVIKATAAMVDMIILGIITPVMAMDRDMLTIVDSRAHMERHHEVAVITKTTTSHIKEVSGRKQRCVLVKEVMYSMSNLNLKINRQMN